MNKYLLFLTLSFSLFADNFYNATSFQGYTGIINTPSAEVLEDGRVEFSFSNQVDAERVRDTRNEYTADQYFINMGIMPNLEFSARLTNIEKKDSDSSKVYGNYLDRDLSFSFKYQLPFYHEYFPHVAIGMQDPTGNGRYKSKYIVATQEFPFVRASAGYSFDSERLDGLFGGMEIKLTDFSYILAEYDSKETQVGLRLNTPVSLSKYVDVSLLVKTNIDDDNQDVSFALNAKIELGENHHQANRTINPEVFSTYTDTIKTASLPAISDLEELKDKLAAFGFENIDIGADETTLYVAYENNIFDQNELDGMGVVLGMAANIKKPYQKFELVVKKSNQKVVMLKGDFNAYKNFITQATVTSVSDFLRTVTFDRSFQTKTALVFENENTSYLKPRLEIAPHIHSFVATEVGVFDYLLSLRPYLHVNLYQGFDLGVLGDLPIYHTRNYDDDRPFRNYNQGNQLESLLLHRSDVIGNFINIASVGMYRDYVAGFNETAYIYDNHTFSLDMGYLEDDEDSKNLYLGSYSYYYDSYDTVFSITAGRYYNEDEGFDIKVKRYFGDTAINFFYQNTEAQFVGIGVEVPLTPRRVANSRYGQIKGKRDFEYHVRTTIEDDTGINAVNPKDAKEAEREFRIRNRFLNRDRLNEDYLKKHILRLRNVYFDYVVD